MPSSRGAHAIIHNDCPRDANIHAELRRDVHDCITARNGCWRKRAAFRAKDVEGKWRMAEIVEQILRALDELDANSAQFAGRGEVFPARMDVHRQLIGGVRGIRLLHVSPIHRAADRDDEGCPECVRGTHERTGIMRFGQPLEAKAKIASTHFVGVICVRVAVRMVTNSSAEVGWMPIVASTCCFVTPA